MSGPLEEALRALGTEPPPVFLREGGRPVEPGWAASGPCLFVDRSAIEALEPPASRFHFGQALAQLRPAALVLRLLGPEVLRSLALGLAGVPPPPGDPVPLKLGRRRARAVERALGSKARARTVELARTWVTDPNRRSLAEAAAAALRTADRAGLVASGSPLVAAAIVGAERPLDRLRLLRFAFEPSMLEPSTSAALEPA